VKEICVSDTDEDDDNDDGLADITARFEVALEAASSAAAAAHTGPDLDNLIARGLVEVAAKVVARMTSPAIAEQLFDAAASGLWDDAHPDGLLEEAQAPQMSAADAEKKRRMRQLQKASRKANRRK
jgi:hypothetical protein